MSVPAIPLISLSNIQERQTHWDDAARSVGRACKEIGFFVICDHNLSIPLLDDVANYAHRFFTLEEAEKMKLHQAKRGRGYIPFASERLAATLGDRGPGDLKETFNIGPEMDRNFWPSSITGFRGAFERLFEAMHSLTRGILRLSETALGLKQGRLDEFISNPKAILRATLYPALKEVPSANQVRASAHTDYGTVTLLYPDGSVGGLQAKHRSGEWIDVNCPPGGLVVNIGDIMQRWTNDVWESTLHRVIIPEGSDLATRDRLSIVFLHNPTPEAVIAPLSEFVGPANPAKYDPITAEAYLCEKSAVSRGERSPS